MYSVILSKRRNPTLAIVDHCHDFGKLDRLSVGKNELRMTVLERHGLHAEDRLRRAFHSFAVFIRRIGDGERILPGGGLFPVHFRTHAPAHIQYAHNAT